MISKDWVVEAAENIQRSEGLVVGSEDRKALIARIIEAHWPFEPDVVYIPAQPGVAYMPVPRCETCAYWHRFELEDIGRCGVVADPPERQYPRALGTLETKVDFGCVQWKAK
jgi:hypothetical protein